MSERVLSIQSHVVSGYVGNKCAVFPLQVLGYEVDYINSVQFSNHTGYGNVKGQVLNEKDLDELYEGLKTNNLVQYDKVLTGYVGSESFLRKIAEVVRDIKSRNPNAVYLCDPVLGDNGHFYVPASLVSAYAELILPLADIITPNTFEIEHLTGLKVQTEADVFTATDILHSKGISTVVLSSLDSDAISITTYVSHQNDSCRRMWKSTTPRINFKFTGTGDLFSALFLGWYSKLNRDLPKVLATVLGTMSKVLSRTQQYALAHPRESVAPPELLLIQSIDDIRAPAVDKEATEVLKN